MLAAILTAVFFTLSAIFSQRAAKLYGALEVNALRLFIAMCILGLTTHIIDRSSAVSSFHPKVYAALFVSGLVGFGLGDVGLFLAYSRLGSRRTILINFCTATLVGAVMDMILLNQSTTPAQGLCVTAILAGLIVALTGGNAADRSQAPLAGIAFALMAGIGQGFGTTLSGWANEVARAHGIAAQGMAAGISQAFQRTTAGVVFAAIALIIARWWTRGNREAESVAAGAGAAGPSFRKQGQKPKNGGCWMAGTAVWGPVLGVSCYQWARMSQSSAIVLAVAATSTLLIIPLARIVEKDKPGPRQLLGTVLAAGGVIALCLVR